MMKKTIFLAIIFIVLCVQGVLSAVTLQRSYDNCKVLHADRDFKFYWTVNKSTGNLQAALVSTVGYASIGFSTDGSMDSAGLGTDIIVSWVDTDGTPRIYDYSVSNHTAPILDAVQNVRLISGNTDGALMAIEFNRPLLYQSDLEACCDRIFNEPVQDQSFYLLWASGDYAPSSPSDFPKHAEKGSLSFHFSDSSTCQATQNPNNGTNTGNNNNTPTTHKLSSFYTIHGIIMLGGFGILIFMGDFIPRYTKSFLKGENTPLIIYGVFQGFSLLCIFAGVGIMWYHSYQLSLSPSDFAKRLVGFHETTGLIIIVIFVCQYILTIVAEKKPKIRNFDLGKLKTILYYTNLAFLILPIIIMVLGFIKLHVKMNVYITFGVWVAFAVLIVLLLELYSRKGATVPKNPQLFSSTTSNSHASAADSELADQNAPAPTQAPAEEEEFGGLLFSNAPAKSLEKKFPKVFGMIKKYFSIGSLVTYGVVSIGLIALIVYFVTLTPSDEGNNNNNNNNNTNTTPDNIVLQFANYTIPMKDHSFVCKQFQFTETRHAIQIDPMVGNQQYVVGIALFAIPSPYDEQNEYFECPPLPDHGSPRYQYTNGASSLVLPDQVGVRLGPSSSTQYVVLQIQYANPSASYGAIDSSGVTVRTTKTLRANDAGVLKIGSMMDGVSIPAGQNSFRVGPGACDSDSTQMLMRDSSSISLFGFLPHGHLAARQIWTDHFRNCRDANATVGAADCTMQEEYVSGTSECCVRVGWIGSSNFDFYSARIMASNEAIQSGDSLYTYCAYNTMGRSSPTVYGSSIYDESCFSFLFYWGELQFASCL